jgi:hypothetical protein
MAPSSANIPVCLLPQLFLNEVALVKHILDLSATFGVGGVLVLPHQVFCL